MLKSHKIIIENLQKSEIHLQWDFKKGKLLSSGSLIQEKITNLRILQVWKASTFL